MSFNFKEPISSYEILALCVSIFALLEPLLIFLWKKYFRKAKLNYYPNGSIELFFNLSGSYVRFFGSLQSENKSVVIKKIELKITRLRDNSERNLLWSTFISPYTQSVGNNFLFTNEAVHPFNVDTNKVSCVFLEFADPAQSVIKEYNNAVLQYEKEINELVFSNINETAISPIKDYFKKRGNYRSCSIDVHENKS